MAVLVEGQSGVHFGGDVAGHDLGELRADADGQPVEDRFRVAVLGGRVEEFADEGGVAGQLRGLEDEGGVGGAVAGLELADGFDVAGVGDDDGHLAQLFEFVHGSPWPGAWPGGVCVAASLRNLFRV